MFHSPVVHTPQRGRKIVTAYLAAAGQTLGNPHFRYIREFHDGEIALLEFETEIDTIRINGGRPHPLRYGWRDRELQSDDPAAEGREQGLGGDGRAIAARRWLTDDSGRSATRPETVDFGHHPHRQACGADRVEFLFGRGARAAHRPAREEPLF